MGKFKYRIGVLDKGTGLFRADGFSDFIEKEDLEKRWGDESKEASAEKRIAVYTSEGVYETTYVTLYQALSHKSTKQDAANPDHYQGFIMDLQWIEAKQYTMPDDLPPFEAALKLQVEKYQDRLGKKDEAIQELRKSMWYLGFWIAYKTNGNKPIRVKDIPELIGIDSFWGQK